MSRWFLELLLLSACGVSPEAALGNPASVFCATSGGRLEMVDTRQGQLGLSFLPNRRIVGEWTFFRDSKGDGKSSVSHRTGAGA